MPEPDNINGPWELIARGERGTPFVQLGRYAKIADAVARISELEGKPYDSLFLRVYVDPNPLTAKVVNGTEDATILARLEYQSMKHYYLLTRECASAAPSLPSQSGPLTSRIVKRPEKVIHSPFIRYSGGRKK